MNELSENKEIIKLEKKLRSEPGGKDYIDELRASGIGELEFKLKELAKHKQAIITTRDNDDELKSAKSHAKVLAAPYGEQLKGNDLRSRFIGLLLQEIEGVSNDYLGE